MMQIMMMDGHLATDGRYRRRRRLIACFLFLTTVQLCLVGNAALKVPKSATEYDEQFFAQHAKIAGVYPVLVKLIQSILPDNSAPSSVVDVGCGHGMLVEAWRAAGTAESYGLEGSPAAQEMWPSQWTADYYQIQDLTKEAAVAAMPRTDMVTTFEVAEHLPEDSADHFVALLATHRPATIVFGAATVNQDRGGNPTHLNENTFEYWIEKFQRNNYSPDLVATAMLRHRLVTDSEFGKHMNEAWWYPKNVLVFVDVSDEKKQRELDVKLALYPKEANLLAENYLGLAGDGEFGQHWRRDWTDFGSIFYSTQGEALARLRNAGEL